MNFKQLNGFVYDSESGVIGAIAEVDFIKQIISILTDGDKIVEAKLGNVEFLEQVAEGVINHDVLEMHGKLYEVELVAEGRMRFNLLNNKLEKVEEGNVFDIKRLSDLMQYTSFVGNLYELEPAPIVDFNIRVVREFVNGETTYYYACNNKDEEEVDLIKVVFIGHHILKEEEYKRTTLTHEEYLEVLESGDFKEVNPQELMNYVTGMSYGKKQDTSAEIKCTECCEDTCDCDCDCDEGKCEDCGESLGDCDCYSW